MKTIKILGTGCPNCLKLESNVKLALKKSWIDAKVEKVSEIENIMAYWIMSSPWLVIDEKVVSSWKVNEIDEIISILNWNNEIKQNKKSCGCSCSWNC